MTPAVFVEHGDLTPEQFKHALHAPHVAWDIETSGLDWANDKIGTCQVHIPDFATVVVKVNGEAPPYLQQLLEDQHVVKVFHHAPFDVRFMMAQWHVRPASVACTKIASKLLRPSAPPEDHSLAALTQRLLDVCLDKTERTSNWLAEDLTQEQLAYAVADVTTLLSVFHRLWADLVAEGLDDLYRRALDHVPTRAELDIRRLPDIYAY